jgi:hypothetical protein
MNESQTNIEVIRAARIAQAKALKAKACPTTTLTNERREWAGY